jgi:rSAM/selenodomain-associated transferase 1
VNQRATGRRLLVFARNPLPGRVKTRLIPSLGAAAATAIYRQLLQDTLLAAARVGGVDSEVWLDEGEPVPWLADIAAAHGLAMRRQSARDLGMRMHAAFSASLRSAEHVVLIGSDCPEFDPGYLEAAFAALAQQDAVLGPAVDGGYVLIGLRAAIACASSVGAGRNCRRATISTSRTICSASRASRRSPPVSDRGVNFRATRRLLSKELH